jgi:hypothetical protein
VQTLRYSNWGEVTIELMKPYCLWLAMRRAPFLVFTLIVTCLGVFAQPAPDAAALDSLLARTKASAMRYEGHLPDFMCTEVTVRKEDIPGNSANWRTLDTLEEVVSFASSGRVSKMLLKKNGRPTTKNRATNRSSAPCVPYQEFLAYAAR